MRPEKHFKNRPPDFEVKVRFLRVEDVGRSKPAFQGYRPDLVFADEPHTWMIWPDFLGEDGASFSAGIAIPELVRADMYVCYEEVRPMLRHIVTVGRNVRMVEGSHTVATGEVTAVKNLPNDLDEHDGTAI